MGGAYDEIDLEDMDWNAELGAFTFQCPCGDLFQITPEELRAGEEVGHCPSCSLVITVVYEPDELVELIPAGTRDESAPVLRLFIRVILHAFARRWLRRLVCAKSSWCSMPSMSKWRAHHG